MNTYHVGPGQTYSTIQDAIADINLRVPAPSALDRCVVMVWAGHYDSTAFGTIDIPAYVSITTPYETHDAVTLLNDTAPLFRCVGQFVGIQNVTVYLPAATDQYAILGNNQPKIRIKGVHAWTTGASKQGRFFKQSGNSWYNVSIRSCVINAGTTTSGGLPQEEGIVFFENTSGGTRMVDVWLEDNFWDCHTFTSDGNILAVHKCEDVRVMRSELRSITSILAPYGRAALVTIQSRVRFNHCWLEGRKNNIYVGSGGGISTADVYNTEGRGRTGAGIGGAGTVNQFNSRL